MDISKTRFISLIKHLRYRDFTHFHGIKDEDELIDESIEDIISLEDEARRQDFVRSFNGDDFEAPIDLKLEMMLPYFSEVEKLAARKVKNLFNGNVEFSEHTKGQKHFKTEVYNRIFHCFLDTYQEDDNTIRIIETKATTNRKFLDMTYQISKGHSESIFTYSNDGILMLKDELLFEVNEHYYKVRNKLFDKFSKEGRYIYDLSYQRYVVENSKQKPNKKIKYYLATLNTEYIHDGSKTYPDDVITLIDLTKITEEYQAIIKTDLLEVVEQVYLFNQAKVTKAVFNYLKTLKDFSVKEIFADVLPKKDSVLTIVKKTSLKDIDGKKKTPYEFIKEGVYNLLDLPDYALINPANQIQYEVVKSKTPYLNKERIKAAINHLRYPLYHLDFESFNCPLPRYKGENPYTQSVFQFSLHIEHESGICDFDLDNHYYLFDSNLDNRKELVSKLVSLIKNDNGHIVVYNQTFEISRLKEFAVLFPEYKKNLMNMVDRIIDLMYFVRGNNNLSALLGFNEDSMFNYYHYDLQGSFSIKKVLPVFTDLKYDDLEVKNGNEAMVTFANFQNMDENEFKKAYDALLFYCKQDTWAMVLILDSLRRLVK